MQRKELKEFRKSQKLTQAEMAEKLDISVSHYKGIEYGFQDPSIDVVIRFHKIFGGVCEDVLKLFISQK